MPDIALQVIPGYTVPSDGTVDAAVLNLLGRPMVKIPNGTQFGPDNLDVPALEAAIGESVRGMNWIPRCVFTTKDWESFTMEALSGEGTQNAADWFVKPTGPPGTVIQYNRIADSPDPRSFYGAELIGATGITSVDFSVRIPSYITQMLRGETLTFSIFCRNTTSDPMYVIPFLHCTALEDDFVDVAEVQVGISQTLLEGVWTRVLFTFQAGDYTNFTNGIVLGVRTANLTGPLKSLRFAQAQLEASAVATTFKRPMQLAREVTKKTLPATVFGPDDKLTGANLLMQINGQTALRLLATPPAAFLRPFLGWNPAGYPEWQDFGSKKLAFTCTKSTQFFKDAVTGSKRIDCWGAGGMEDSGISGGVGGYTYGYFPATKDADCAVVVGEGATRAHRNVNPFGFGGWGSVDGNWGGGGLAGVFSGAGDVTAGDAGRALIIAGGGGAGGQAGGGNNATQGGNGNDPSSSGGESTFQGHQASVGISGGGGGGGGYQGGTFLSLSGKGGTGFLHASKLAGEILASTRPSLLVPGTSAANYQAGIGGPQQPGLVVVTFANPLVIPNNPVKPGVRTLVYSTNLTAEGGWPAYVWSLESGTLPPGLSLSADGVLSGTPTALGNFTATFKATDQSTATASRAFTINIT